MLLKRKAVYTTKSMDFSSVILSSILQVFVFTMVPFIAYLISYRKVRGFGKYIGFHRPEKKAMLYATLFVLVTIPLRSEERRVGKEGRRGVSGWDCTVME